MEMEKQKEEFVKYIENSDAMVKSSIYNYHLVTMNDDNSKPDFVREHRRSIPFPTLYHFEKVCDDLNEEASNSKLRCNMYNLISRINELLKQLETKRLSKPEVIKLNTKLQILLMQFLYS